VAQNNDILFKITFESISQMIQIQNYAPMKPFGVYFVMGFYKNLTFPYRAKIFETFLSEDA